MTNESGKTCFVIAPIGEPESDTRRRSDQILRHIIRPAVESKGYTAIRADEISEPGIITSQVIQHVVDDQLVVADLTERNPNVFYELAVRHAIRKPFIQVIDKRENIPFDVAATRTVLVDHHDLDNVETAKAELSEQIVALESDSTTLETPISVSLDLQHLRRSENPGERSLADVLSELSSIRGTLAEFEERVAASSGGFSRREFRLLEERLATQLANQIESLILSTQQPTRRNRIDPSQIMNLAHSARTEYGHPVAVPVLLSFLREDLPWVYELGMEGYRQITAGSEEQGKGTFRGLLHLMDQSLHIIGNRPELNVAVMELRQLLGNLIGRP